MGAKIFTYPNLGDTSNENEMKFPCQGNQEACPLTICRKTAASSYIYSFWQKKKK
jgi:hypothetical protein